jgi:hypothetical protein
MKEWLAHFMQEPAKLGFGKRQFRMGVRDALIVQYLKTPERPKGGEYKTALSEIETIRYHPLRAHHFGASVEVQITYWRGQRYFFFKEREKAHAFFKALKAELEKKRKPLKGLEADEVSSYEPFLPDQR